MNLESFSPSMAPTLLSWVGSFQENLFWCERKDYPSGPEIFAHWHLDTDVRAYIGYHHQEPVVYAEILCNQDLAESEILHLLVAPDKRRQGFGKEMISALIQTVDLTGISQTYARLMPHNIAAIACFQAAGFEAVSEEKARQLNEWEAQPSHWLELRHDD